MTKSRLMTAAFVKMRNWRRVGLIFFLTVCVLTALRHLSFTADSNLAFSPARQAAVTAAKLRSSGIPLLFANANVSDVGDVSDIRSVPECPDVPPDLVGLKSINPHPLSLDDLEKKWSTVIKMGGSYRPPNCRAKNRTAIIIPCRNRWAHLRVLLGHLIPFLIRQQISFTFFVVESDMSSRFNKGILLNAGVRESLKFDDYNCFVFQDVDLLPLNDYNLYRCASQPTHLAVAISKFDYKLPYIAYFGGALVLSREQLFAVNGHSNVFFGWGGEDDDIQFRVKVRGYTIRRLPLNMTQYHMLLHSLDEGNEVVALHLGLLSQKASSRRMYEEGLCQSKYKLEGVATTPLYTWVKVTINQEEVIKSFPDYVQERFKQSALMQKH